ncbi:hypothetical protein PYCCODRAFT_1473205 [Trametes coccinea BRFM310]|uniref:Uncharacterized protein n=1 Tax=Trametes coccinea (strain BRFM310) TaxID=1353009 RepID=A0A1Y2J6V3_TRAC3|nr:hypothetical protein PYCCODRAFT_1473205 [Trametes coccinea BRFM310]
MSLKIRIGKPNLISESRPSKRRIQRIESEDEEEANSHEPSHVEAPQQKKRRTSGRHSGDDDDAEGEAEVDVDIDGDIEDTRFLPDPPPTASRSMSPAAGTKRRLSSAAASSGKARAKESKPAKSKSSGKKPRRQVVWTDDEDEEEFDDPEVVVTDDDDFDPEPDYSSKKSGKAKSTKTGSGKAGGKSKGGKDKDDKEITFRDERKITATNPGLSERPSGPVRSSSVLAVDPLDEANIPKKRKLPPIKKNKPSTAGSTAPSTPSAPKPLGVASDKKETLTPALTSNQVGTRKPAGASADLNLLDSSVYSELFKSKPGAATPNSGLNRKQKEEERRRELNKMRDEARAKREADAKNSFDLQAAPEKIERFVLLRLRHSTARYPNVLGAVFKEMYDRNRASAPVAEHR